GDGDTVPNCVDLDDDNDTVDDVDDNCPLEFNTEQEDLDVDGLGDECDPDLDGDGVPNAADNCVDEANPLQEDADLDGVGDVCEVCLGLADDGLDSDGDLYGDACDDFPFDPAEWSDHDEDGIGDNGDEDDFDYGKLVYTVPAPDPLDLEAGKELVAGEPWAFFRHDLRRTGRSTIKSDLKSPTAIWRHYLGGMLSGRKALLHDLDADGTPELLAVSGGSVVAWRTTGEKVWDSGVLGLGAEELVGAVDLDGNGTAEILALRTHTSPGWWIIRAKTGQVINGFTSILGSGSDESLLKLDVEVLNDVTGDGLPDVVVNASNYAVATLWQVWSFPWGPEAPALWSENKDTSKQEFGMAIAGDVDGDGKPELITQSFDSLLKVFEIPATKGQPMVASISCQFCSSIGAFHVEDVDGDGADELLVVKDGPLSYCDRVGLVDFSGGKCTQVWSRFDTSPANIRIAAPWGTGVTDLDGDGDLEVALSVLDMDGDAKWHMQILDAKTGTTLTDVADRIPFHVLDADGKGEPEILVVHTKGDVIPASATQVSSVRFEAGALVPAGLALDGVLPAYSAPRYVGLDNNAVHRWVELYTRVGEMALAGKTEAGHSRGVFFSDPDLDGIVNAVLSVDLATGDVEAKFEGIPFGVGMGIPYSLDLGGKGFLVLARNDGLSSMLDFSLTPVSELLKAGGYYNNATRVADLDGDLVPEILVQNSRNHTMVLHAPASTELSGLAPEVVKQDPRPFATLVPKDGQYEALALDRTDPTKLQVILLKSDLAGIQWKKDLPATSQMRWVDPLLVGGQWKTAVVAQLQDQNSSLNNSLTAWMAQDGSELWSKPGDVPMAGRGGTSVDLDGVAGEEYVTCSTGNDCCVFSGVDGTRLYSLNKDGKYYIGLPYTAVAADLDGKGAPELVTGGANHETGAFRLDSLAPWSFTQLWEVAAATQSSAGLAFVDDDGLPDVVYWNSQDGLVAKRGTDGTVLWQIGLSGGAVVSSAVGKNIRLGNPAIADIDGDGDDDLLIGSPDGFLYCLDVKSVDLLWSIYFRTTVGEPVIADVDGKGLAEILVPVADGYVYLLDQPL
ncbi:MAG: hypothetical protein FJ109_14650, partial [Deltaproteobacteria bacterium]|nr:hypothetical protein [Deltaproteobacteria bacterium]